MAKTIEGALASALADSGLSREELANRAKVPRSTIDARMRESGRMRMCELLKLAKVLGIRIQIGDFVYEKR